MINTHEIPPMIKELFNEDRQEAILEALNHPPDDLSQRLEDIPANISELIAYAKREAHDTCAVIFSHLKQASKLASFSQSIKEPLM